MKNKIILIAITLLIGKSASASEKAVLAGGCFWGMQEIIRHIPGVEKTVVGYSGGNLEKVTYGLVSTGSTGFAESVEITFNPKVLSYEKLLTWFFRMHDPTTKNQQGNDVGTQYRSAIFYNTPTQQKIARDSIERVSRLKKWKNPIVTEVVPYKNFIKAEDNHQDYLQKNPKGYTCHFLRPE